MIPTNAQQEAHHVIYSVLLLDSCSITVLAYVAVNVTTCELDLKYNAVIPRHNCACTLCAFQ